MVCTMEAPFNVPQSSHFLSLNIQCQSFQVNDLSATFLPANFLQFTVETQYSPKMPEISFILKLIIPSYNVYY
jgi:hypothetical protein